MLENNEKHETKILRKDFSVTHEYMNRSNSLVVIFFYNLAYF